MNTYNVADTAAVIMMAAIFALCLWHDIIAAHTTTTGPESIIQAVHDAHNYIPEVYTCDNYTLDALRELRMANFNATYMIGCQLNAEKPPVTKCHAWPRVCTAAGCRDYDVTSGTGEPKYADYDNIQTLTDR